MTQNSFGGTGPIIEEDLQAYIDGEIDLERRKLVEAYLEENPSERARVRAYESQSHILHSAFDPIAEEAIPDQILVRTRSQSLFNPMGIAAGIALFAIGALSGWYANEIKPEVVVTASPPNFTAHAVAAHQIYTKENRHAVEVAAKQEKHLVRWLSKRLKQKINVPVLANFGYELVGGRLLAPTENVPAAQFMYQDEKLNRLTLYVRRAEKSETTSFRFEKKGSATMFYWIDSPMAYALIGELPREKLLTISNRVYDQLSK